MNLLHRLHNWYNWVGKSDDLPKPIRALVLFSTGVTVQGLLYMDRSERIIKTGITASLALIIYPITRGGIGTLVKSLALGHILNFLLNGQPWVIAKNLDMVSTPEHEFENRMERLSNLDRHEGVAAVLVYGSHVRAESDESSDLDVRVIRYPGFINAVLVPLLVAKERTLANVSRFPLDIYTLDGFDSLEQLREDEQPTALVDKESYFAEQSDS
jgi:predicted nucleotidyltransferase